MNGLMSFLDAQKANSYLLMRIVIGVTLAYHGYGKAFGFGIDGVGGFFGSIGLPMPGLLAYAVTILELVGGIAILLGVFTRLLGIWMIVQFGLIVIWVKPMLMAKEFSGDGGSEIDLLLMAMGAVLAATGPGMLALGPMLLKNMRWAE